ncbi:thermonuclease family protein [Henriciella pelagia]|jgi:endonuclease YncB( thermonuclease family)|uniref:TNase-like domain-containing protein n=1 Tax=Henriciella pelagia TaxID=1977912 RepID=A0ABQ1J941_9PROT|nr:thermonuclease family protein [Henriciella pelagia]GGB63110.1 hypothetical protein GCM10011503_09770 [Henriciella pelagia]
MDRRWPVAYSAALIGLAACNSGGYEQPPNLCEAAGTRCVSVPVRDLLAVDGDTFELRRLSASGGEQRVRLRLIGWDSPETGDAAQCPEENALGQKTEARAREMFAEGSKVTFLPEGTDQYGRTRAHVYLDGVHIGWLLSKDGLAQPLEEGRQVDWCG